MSKRRGRKRKDENPASRPDAAPRAGFPWKSILLTALAIGVSAVFFRILLDDGSMLSAFRGVEYVNLLGEANGAARRGGPTWDDAYRELKEKLTADPVTRKHQAVALMLKLFLASHAGTKPPADALKESDPAFVADPENRLTRLIRWGLEDLADAGKQSATQRFLLARSIFDSKPPLATTSLYTDHLTRRWHDIVRAYVLRPDAAANYALWLEHMRTTDHFRAFDLLRARMMRLREALLKEGHTGAADQCTAWLVQTFRGLMQGERDSGTRLLCADMLRRVIDHQSEAAHALNRLKHDFHAHAERCPGDLTAPDKPPVTDPHGYRRALGWLIAAGALQAEAIGASLTLFAAAVLAFVKRRVSNTVAVLGLNVATLAPMLTLAVGSTMAPLVMALRSDDTVLYSQISMLLYLLGCAFYGAAIALWTASRSTAARGITHLLPMLPAMAAAILILLPASTYAALNERLGEPLVLPVLLSVIVLFMFVSCLAVADVSAAALARGAINTFAFAGVLALVALLLHVHADGQYLRRVAGQRMDEFAARLGEDWESAYLAGLAVHESPRPATAHSSPSGATNDR